MLLSRSLRQSLYALGRATKITFVQGHGYTREELTVMEMERKGTIERLRIKVTDDWHIPEHILCSEAFSYETELHSWFQRVGCNGSYLPQASSRAADDSGWVAVPSNLDQNSATLSAAFLTVFAHPSSCPREDVLELRRELCELGGEMLSLYLLNFYSLLFPNISTEVLYKLSRPETCLSQARAYSLYKTLCFHELIRSREDDITLEEYSDTLAGVFASILLFDKFPSLSAPRFLENWVLNYYAQIDFRDLAIHETLEVAEKKMQDLYVNKGFNSTPEIRIVTIDGEDTELPLYTVGIFYEGSCVATAAENTVEDATLAACNAVITKLNFEERNGSARLHDLNFRDLDEGVVERGRELGERLKALFEEEGFSLKDAEQETPWRKERVVITKQMVRNIQKFRRVRFKKEEKQGEDKKEVKEVEGEDKKEIPEGQV